MRENNQFRRRFDSIPPCSAALFSYFSLLFFPICKKLQQFLLLQAARNKFSALKSLTLESLFLIFTLFSILFRLGLFNVLKIRFYIKRKSREQNQQALERGSLQVLDREIFFARGKLSSEIFLAAIIFHLNYRLTGKPVDNNRRVCVSGSVAIILSERAATASDKRTCFLAIKCNNVMLCTAEAMIYVWLQTAKSLYEPRRFFIFFLFCENFQSLTIQILARKLCGKPFCSHLFPAKQH
jgi:hypothetical protein